MITLTPREYLVEITLKYLKCQPSMQITKISSELHYDQSYVKFKTHPQIAPNGIVNFKKQTICIPYCSDIAIVFKKNTSSQKQVFLGHFCIDIVEYLQRKIYYIQINQKLSETEIQVNFQCKLIDKQLFAESQTQDLSEQESNLQKSQYSVLENEEPVNMRKSSMRETLSEFQFNPRSPNSSPKLGRNSIFERSLSNLAQPQYTNLLPQQLSKKLCVVEQIVAKKNLILTSPKNISGFRRDKKGHLKSDKIQKLQILLKNKKQQFMFNSSMLYVLIGLASLFIGIVGFD